MAATLKLDWTTRAVIDERPLFKRIVRTGWIDGMHTTGLLPNQVFAACDSICNAAGVTYNSSYGVAPYTDLLLSQRVFTGRPGDPRKVDVLLVYETFQGMRPVTFVLSRRTTTVDVVTEIDPATKKPIVVSWTNPNDDKEIIARTAQIRYKVPYQRLLAEGYYYTGPPPASMLGALNSVNDGLWRGLPKGYWHYCDQSDVTKDFGDHYHITVELETKIIEDWTEWVSLCNPNGVYIKVTDSTVSFLKSQSYKFGTIMGNGLTRCGPYPLANFTAIFGFGNIG